MDPVSTGIKTGVGERKDWVLEELNTKPGVTYLQKSQRDSMSEARA